MDSRQILSQAEALLQRGDDIAAAEQYQKLVTEADLVEMAPLSHFRLGEIFNRQRNVVKAIEHHFQAFSLKPDLAAQLVPANHRSHPYVFQMPEETYVSDCPLCGRRGRLHSAFNAVTNVDFIPGFNPIRIWMECEHCHHLFAHNYPARIGDILAKTAHNLNPNVARLPTLGMIMSRILSHAPGYRLLEVGVGAGEMTAVAKEYLFEVTGVDIRPMQAEVVSRMLDVPVHAVDFLKLETDQEFDVICMGDVIEHLPAPSAVLEKARAMLVDRGVLWLSTPNFESGFTMILKDRDPMWRVVEHLNYFSFRSLHELLERSGFRVMEYHVSAQYNGSMEILAIKEGP
ncbi:MAG TPA: class I SAM-dependent methyltransferase [Symbiobacteriaceae bacterium]|nr:class I SAM-dependent methyltransferase [Symbiobacteriaceae bacterium]